MGKLLFLVLFSIAMLPLRYFLIARDHQRIRAYLKEREYEALDIAWRSNPPIISRGGAYEVVYVNAKNELYRARCYAENLSTLFWTEPVFLYSVTARQLDRLKQLGRRIPSTMPFEAKSEKEKVVDGLTSVFKYERIWAVKELLQIENVDGQMLQLLKTVASHDEENEVREAAIDTINKLQIIEEG